MADHPDEIIEYNGGAEKARIRWHGRNNYCLSIISHHSARARWGTYAEIKQDAAYFAEHGKLPPASTNGTLF